MKKINLTDGFFLLMIIFYALDTDWRHLSVFRMLAVGALGVWLVVFVIKKFKWER